MNSLLLLWVSLSLSGALVTITLRVLKPFLRHFGKVWKYYAWLLVILRLLIPFSPNVSIVGSLFQQFETHFSIHKQSADYTPGNDLKEAVQFFATPVAENAVLEEYSTAPTIFYFINNHIWGTLWLVAAIILITRKTVGYVQFSKTVKRQSKPITDEQLSAAFHTVRAAMGIEKDVTICLNPLVRAPMLVGIIRPMIVLPTTAISISKLMLIFRHELTHYRRKDFFYKCLVELTVCLHWFNPLVYWVRRQMNQDCELSCDESIVIDLADQERQTYGEMLLDSIVISNRNKANPILLSLNEDGRLIKERLCSIMKYHRKTKFIVFFAAVLTSVLLCGSVFAGAYTAAAAETIKTASTINPIRIDRSDLAPGGKISLGSQYLISGVECQILLTWTGNYKLAVLCTASNGSVKSYSIESGQVTAFQIDSGGAYTIAVKNNTENKVSNVNGSIEFKHTTANQQSQNAGIPVQSGVSSPQSIVYENVEMRRYKEADGHPYVHDRKTNNTTNTIIGCQHGMLAFDEHGNPLKIDWWSLDDESDNNYYNLHSWDSTTILPGETSNVRGGWSLNFYELDPEVNKIAYVLYCDKEITFEDGSVWTNPNFESWRTAYEGKKIDVDILESYYPYEQIITF